MQDDKGPFLSAHFCSGSDFGRHLVSLIYYVWNCLPTWPTYYYVYCCLVGAICQLCRRIVVSGNLLAVPEP